MTLSANTVWEVRIGGNDTNGGGALLRAAGYPGVFPGGLTTGYTDIGAAQHEDSHAVIKFFGVRT